RIGSEERFALDASGRAGSPPPRGAPRRRWKFLLRSLGGAPCTIRPCTQGGPMRARPGLPAIHEVGHAVVALTRGVELVRAWIVPDPQPADSLGGFEAGREMAWSLPLGSRPCCTR